MDCIGWYDGQFESKARASVQWRWSLGWHAKRCARWCATQRRRATGGSTPRSGPSWGRGWGVIGAILEDDKQQRKKQRTRRSGFMSVCDRSTPTRGLHDREGLRAPVHAAPPGDVRAASSGISVPLTQSARSRNIRLISPMSALLNWSLCLT